MAALQSQVSAMVVASMRAMLIVREFELRKALTGVLQGLGLRQVTTAQSLAEAADRMSFAHYSVAVVDDRLEGGATALAEALAKSRGASHGCAIVALCAQLDGKRLVELQTAKVADILVKPIAADRLTQSLLKAAFR
jgi:DNA-binding NtrC family response regulator